MPRTVPIARLTEAQKAMVKKMVTEGGFGHRYIAATVFRTTTVEVTDLQVRCVTSFARREKIRVMDWRTGVSMTAKQYVQRLLGMRRARDITAG